MWLHGSDFGVLSAWSYFSRHMWQRRNCSSKAASSTTMFRLLASVLSGPPVAMVFLEEYIGFYITLARNRQLKHEIFHSEKGLH